MSVRWEDIVAFAMTLPGAKVGSAYGRPALKVRDKSFAIAGKQADHFVLMSSLDEVEMLIATDPECFFQTPHYEGWPTVLVRFATAEPDRIEALIERAWAARASQAQRRQRAAQEED